MLLANGVLVEDVSELVARLDEIAPRETYEMNPDNTILAELRTLADDIRFFSHIKDARIEELSQALHFVDEIARNEVTWDHPRVLDWDLIDER